METFGLDLIHLDLLGNHRLRLQAAIRDGIHDLLKVTFGVRGDANILALPKSHLLHVERDWFLPHSDIDDSASRSHGIDSSIQTGLHACSIEYFMHALAIAEFTASSGNVVFAWIEDILRTKLLCELLSPSAISETMISSTPFAFRASTTARPIGPPPSTRTESSLETSPTLTACHETESGSTSAPISSGTLSGNLKTKDSLRTTYSA